MLLGLFRTLAGIAAEPCSPQRQSGEHGRLIGGLGLMGDAICCLRCGRERYDEDWTAAERARQEPVSRALHPLLREARRLPGGLDTQAARPDPEFDAWFRTGRWPHRRRQGRRRVGLIA